MDIEEYNNLKEKIDNKSFEQNYQIINKILYFSSFLGNVASIIFAYFFLNTILNNSTDEFPGKNWVLPVISIITLSTFELLKRFMFRRLSLSWISNKKFNKEIVFNFILSIMIVCSSFYLAISGAKKFADKEKQIVELVDNNIKIESDSLNKIYEVKIDRLEKDKETWIGLLNGTKSVKLRSEYNQSITKINDDIKFTDIERTNKIKELEQLIKEKSNSAIVESNSNQLAFILIISFIEFLILIGVWFDVFYKYTSLKEYEEKLLSNDQYHQYLLHEKLLFILYNNGKLKNGEQIISFTKLNDLIKLSGIRITQKAVRDFLIVANNLTILITLKGKKYIDKSFEEAKEILKNHYRF